MMWRAAVRSIPILLFAVFGLCCDELPRDQSGTTKGIAESGKLRVGLIENPPWVIRTDGEPAGAEVQLVREFAAEANSVPEWHWGGEEKLLGALEKFELDVVIGGLSDTTPWKNRIGLTSQYYKEKFDIGVTPGTPAPSDLKDLKVAVPKDVRIAGMVREKDAVPIQISDLTNTRDVPVAAAEWKLKKLGLSPAQYDLHTDRHVIATPPGENQLVKRLDKFLSDRKEQIPEILSQQPEEMK